MGRRPKEVSEGASKAPVTAAAKHTSASKDLMKKFLKATGNEYGAIAADGLASDIIQWTDTGCLLWNMQMSADLFRGIPNGKVTGFAGPSGTLKTYACISVISNFQKQNPDSYVFIFDSENAITSDRLKERQVDLTRVVHLPVKSLPDFKNQCYQVLKEANTNPGSENTKYLIILDSLGNLPSAREILNADTGKEAADMGARSKDIRSIFRVLTVMLSKNQIPMICTNHTFAKIGSWGGGQEMGADGLRYASDIIAIFTKAQAKEGDDRVGSIITSTLEKGRDSREKTKVKMMLHYQYGLHKYYGLIEWAVNAGLIEKKKGKEEDKKSGKKNKEEDYKEKEKKKKSARYLIDGKEYSETEIYKNAETIFTEDMLKKLNEYMKPYFSYGGLKDNNESNPEIGDVEEEETTPQEEN